MLLHSFLHRVVNGGGWIHREQPLGAGRADLLIVWPDREGDGARRYVVECKLARRGAERAVAGGTPADGGGTWTAAMRRAATWWCSISTPAAPGRRRSTAAPGNTRAKRSPSGACKRRSPGVRYSEAMRFFNRMGPVEREEHYCIPPLERVDLEEILTLVRQRAYFVVHAPRQTGENLDPAGAPRPAELGVRGGLPLRVCEPGGRADGGGRR